MISSSIDSSDVMLIDDRRVTGCVVHDPTTPRPELTQQSHSNQSKTDKQGHARERERMNRMVRFEVLNTAKGQYYCTNSGKCTQIYPHLSINRRSSAMIHINECLLNRIADMSSHKQFFSPTVRSHIFHFCTNIHLQLQCSRTCLAYFFQRPAFASPVSYIMVY
jgi:hypothetical protein